MNRTPFEKAGDFLLGRGFYIVLFLCVATIGFSGYYLIQTLTPSTGDTITPVTSSPEITIPDPTPQPPVIPSPVIPVPTEPEVPEVPEVTDTAQAVTNLPVPEPPAEPVPAPDPVPTVYTWPVKGEILRDFSVETLSLDATMGDWRTHDGLDIAADLGTNVLAPGRGVVVSVVEDDLMGSTVVIQHTDGVISTLANLSASPVVSEGDEVEPGAVIGTVSDTAMAESGLPPHLHLAMSLEGAPLDPNDLLPE